jgi:hypothetical protein
MVCSHLWLNLPEMITILSHLPMDDGHLGYIKNFLEKTVTHTPYFGGPLQIIFIAKYLAQPCPAHTHAQLNTIPLVHV